MIKIAITDDQSIVQNGLQKILENAAGIALCGIYSNGGQLLEGLSVLQPDVLLLDIQMPGLSGLEVAAIVGKKYPAIKIIALTNMNIIVQVKKMLQLGCVGYLLKDTSPETLILAIETVYEGGQYLSEDIRTEIQQQQAGIVLKPQVTRREKEILKLIVDEYTNQQIADTLYLSLRTVENHRNNLLQKLNVKNTAGLVKIALTEGLI